MPSLRAGLTRKLTFSAMFVALLSVCSWISVPAPVPFTLQTFGVFCTLGLLGGKWGTRAIAAYLLLGAAGAPVFAGWKGGLGALFGATGGYLVGFLLCALLYRLIMAHGGGAWRQGIALWLGLAGCYGFGSLWYFLVYSGDAPLSFAAVFTACVAPFLLPDLLKLALALVLIRRLRPRLGPLLAG